MLDELQLKWSIHHDVLMITTPKKAEGEEYLYTKCYDVSDLLAFPEGIRVAQSARPAGKVIESPDESSRL